MKEKHRTKFATLSKFNFKNAISKIMMLWAGAISSTLIGLLTQIFLARSLPQSEYGAISAAINIVTLAIVLVAFGIPKFWLKAFGKEGHSASRWIYPSWRFLSYSIPLSLLTISGWAVWGPHSESMKLALLALMSYFISMILAEFLTSKLQLEERYKELVIWQLTPKTIRLLFIAVTFYSATLSFNVVLFFYATTGIVFTYFLIKELGGIDSGRLKLIGHKDSTKEGKTVGVRDLLKEGWPFGLASLFYLIYFQIDIVLINYIIDERATAIYNIAFLVISAVYILPSVIFQKYLLPKLHRWAYQDTKRFRAAYLIGNRVMIIGGIVAAVLTVYFSDALISIVFGKSYVEAVSVIFVLSFAIPIRFLSTSVGSTLVTKHFMVTKVKLMGVVAVFNLISNIIFIPIYGIIGAAVTTVISEMLLLSLYYYTARNFVFKNSGMA